MVVRECVVCGKKFLGRPNATLCSGECRIASKKSYMAAYREKNADKIKEDKRKWYCNHKGVAFVPKEPQAPPKRKEEDVKPPIQAKDKKNYYLANEQKVICKDSRWGRKYLTRDRLEQLVMLSAELSAEGIAKISYGYLSAIRDFEVHRYLRLLKSVIDAKEAN